jgi:outer membrane receptor for ferrienterochelin and colicin
LLVSKLGPRAVCTMVPYCAISFLCVVLAESAWSANDSPAGATRELTEMSLEDLMNEPVTSVSKKEQKLSQVAAAIFVINQEDIRRSGGALNIPDVLRMVPGLDVAQINANTWAIWREVSITSFPINCWFSSTAALSISRPPVA